MNSNVPDFFDSPVGRQWLTIWREPSSRHVITFPEKIIRVILQRAVTTHMIPFITQFLKPPVTSSLLQSQWLQFNGNRCCLGCLQPLQLDNCFHSSLNMLGFWNTGPRDNDTSYLLWQLQNLTNKPCFTSNVNPAQNQTATLCCFNSSALPLRFGCVRCCRLYQVCESCESMCRFIACQSPHADLSIKRPFVPSMDPNPDFLVQSIRDLDFFVGDQNIHFMDQTFFETPTGYFEESWHVWYCDHCKSLTTIYA